MSIPRLLLSHTDYRALVMVVDGYLQSLLIPEVFPEHSVKHTAVLEKLKNTFHVMANTERNIPLLITEPEIVALDAAVEGFIRICNRTGQPTRKNLIAIQSLMEFRQELAMMKFPLSQ